LLDKCILHAKDLEEITKHEIILHVVILFNESNHQHHNHLSFFL